jgi:hypothetical protein
MARGFRAYAAVGAVARAQARETLRGRAGAAWTQVDITADRGGVAKTRTLSAPSVADLVDKDRSMVTVDAKWLSSRTLNAMRGELRQHAAAALAGGNLGAYETASKAAAAADFVLRVLSTSEGGRR